MTGDCAGVQDVPPSLVLECEGSFGCVERLRMWHGRGLWFVEVGRVGPGRSLDIGCGSSRDCQTSLGTGHGTQMRSGRMGRVRLTYGARPGRSMSVSVFNFIYF